MAVVTHFSAGQALSDVSIIANGGGHSTNDAIVAHPGGAQAGATKLDAMFNVISVVATDGNSVALPPATGGIMLTIVNAHPVNGVTLWVAPGTSDQLLIATGGGLVPDTSVVVGPGRVIRFLCTAGMWYGDMGAAS